MDKPKLYTHSKVESEAYVDLADDEISFEEPSFKYFQFFFDALALEITKNIHGNHIEYNQNKNTEKNNQKIKKIMNAKLDQTRRQSIQLLRQHQFIVQNLQDSCSNNSLIVKIVKHIPSWEIVQIYCKLGIFSKKFCVLNVFDKSTISLTLNPIIGGCSNAYKFKWDCKQFVIKTIQFKKQTLHPIFLKDVIKQYFIASMMSALQIGACIKKISGFDFVIYQNCVEFCMQECEQLLNQPFEQELKHNLFRMHSLNICHLDIKPQNIMYSQTYNKTVFIDFGVSKLIKQNVHTKTLTGPCGTFQYASPQMQRLFLLGEKRYINLYLNDVLMVQKSMNNIVSIKRIQNKNDAEYGARIKVNYDKQKSKQCKQQIQIKFFNQVSFIATYNNVIQTVGRIYSQTKQNKNKKYNKKDLIDFKQMYETQIFYQSMKYLIYCHSSFFKDNYSFTVERQQIDKIIMLVCKIITFQKLEPFISSLNRQRIIDQNQFIFFTNFHKKQFSDETFRNRNQPIQSIFYNPNQANYWKYLYQNIHKSDSILEFYQIALQNCGQVLGNLQNDQNPQAINPQVNKQIQDQYYFIQLLKNYQKVYEKFIKKGLFREYLTLFIIYTSFSKRIERVQSQDRVKMCQIYIQIAKKFKINKKSNQNYNWDIFVHYLPVPNSDLPLNRALIQAFYQILKQIITYSTRKDNSSITSCLHFEYQFQAFDELLKSSSNSQREKLQKQRIRTFSMNQSQINQTYFINQQTRCIREQLYGMFSPIPSELFFETLKNFILLGFNYYLFIKDFLKSIIKQFLRNRQLKSKFLLITIKQSIQIGVLINSRFLLMPKSPDDKEIFRNDYLNKNMFKFNKNCFQDIFQGQEQKQNQIILRKLNILEKLWIFYNRELVNAILDYQELIQQFTEIQKCLRLQFQELSQIEKIELVSIYEKLLDYLKSYSIQFLIGKKYEFMRNSVLFYQSQIKYEGLLINKYIFRQKNVECQQINSKGHLIDSKGGRIPQKYIQSNGCPSQLQIKHQQLKSQLIKRFPSKLINRSKKLTYMQITDPIHISIRNSQQFQNSIQKSLSAIDYITNQFGVSFLMHLDIRLQLLVHQRKFALFKRAIHAIFKQNVVGFHQITLHIKICYAVNQFYSLNINQKIGQLLYSIWTQNIKIIHSLIGKKYNSQQNAFDLIETSQKKQCDRIYYVNVCQAQILTINNIYACYKNNNEQFLKIYLFASIPNQLFIEKLMRQIADIQNSELINKNLRIFLLYFLTRLPFFGQQYNAANIIKILKTYKQMLQNDELTKNEYNYGTINNWSIYSKHIIESLTIYVNQSTLNQKCKQYRKLQFNKYQDNQTELKLFLQQSVYYLKRHSILNLQNQFLDMLFFLFSSKLMQFSKYNKQTQLVVEKGLTIFIHYIQKVSQSFILKLIQTLQKTQYKKNAFIFAIYFILFQERRQFFLSELNLKKKKCFIQKVALNLNSWPNYKLKRQCIEQYYIQHYQYIKEYNIIKKSLFKDQQNTIQIFSEQQKKKLQNFEFSCKNRSRRMKLRRIIKHVLLKSLFERKLTVQFIKYFIYLQQQKSQSLKTKLKINKLKSKRLNYAYVQLNQPVISNSKDINFNKNITEKEVIKLINRMTGTIQERKFMSSKDIFCFQKNQQYPKVSIKENPIDFYNQENKKLTEQKRINADDQKEQLPAQLKNNGWSKAVEQNYRKKLIKGFDDLLDYLLSEQNICKQISQNQARKTSLAKYAKLFDKYICENYQL